MSKLVINGKEFKSGQKDIACIPVTKDLGGFDINIFSHIVTGNEGGPTLLLLSMLHGNEWLSVLILKEIVNRINPAKLKGNIIAVPVANPSAFLTGTRCVMDQSDEPDANRAFGGDYKWITNQITNVIDDNFMSQSDFLIDYHISDWGSTMADIGYGSDYKNKKTSETSKNMALAYDFPMIHAMKLFSGTHSDRTSMGYAGVNYDIPAIVPEIGGLGYGKEKEEEWLEQNVHGTINTMKYLKMLDGKVSFRKKYLFIGNYWRISPSVGGYLEPVFGLERQFSLVKKNELIAKVISPTTFEVLEELRSPGKGVVFYMCRSYMCRPGGWGFGIANMEDGSSYWEEY